MKTATAQTILVLVLTLALFATILLPVAVSLRDQLATGFSHVNAINQELTK